jgi:hypothetical protein
MTSSTCTIQKLGAAIALVAAFAILTPSALAAGGCPCNKDLPLSANTTSAAASAATPQGLKADGLRWQGIAKVYQQNQLGQAVALTRVSRLAVPTSSLNRPAKQYTTAAKLVPAVPGNGFDWGDAGIGVAAAIGSMLLAAAGTIGLRKRSRLALHS